MASYRDDLPQGRDDRMRASWLDDDRQDERGQGRTRRQRGRGRDDEDDYSRELSNRYGHGDGGYDRGAYAQGGYGESAHDQGGFGRGSSGEDWDGPRGGRGGGQERSRRGSAFSDRGYGEGRGFGASQGEDRFRTGVFMGGADQDFRSGGQYQGESGFGARSGYSGDYTGGGYLGRGSGARPQREGRSGGSFGEDPRGWHGPGASSGTGSHWGQADTDRGSARFGGQRGRGPKNYTRTDQRITEDLCERLTDDDHVDAGGIEVQVKDGVATLTGNVPQRWMKHRAEDLAEACGGVRDVENRLRVSKDSGSSGGRGEATPASGTVM